MFVWSSLSRRVFTSASQAVFQSYSKVFGRHITNIVSQSNPVVGTSVGDKFLRLDWEDDRARFHYLWLRHHCKCSQCLDPKTKQRLLDPSLIPDLVKPKRVDVDGYILQITWNDGHRTDFDVCWLKENSYDSKMQCKTSGKSKYGSIAYESEITLWNQEVISPKHPYEFSYRDVTEDNEEVIHAAMNTLFRYGFVFVNGTPLDVESTVKVGQHLVGPIRETVEGRVYVLENKALRSSDLSHFSGALHAHTDFSFYSDPPGLQIMHCTYHQGSRGMSLAVDGFNAAKTLFHEDPEAYKILSSTPLRFKSSYYQVQSIATILELNPLTRALEKIRWNNSRIDELVNVNLNFDEMERFYEAMKSFGSILRREENELWFKLTPGKTYVIDNRRVLHGRSAVQGPRTLIGYYVSGDDYIAKWKRINSGNTVY